MCSESGHIESVSGHVDGILKTLVAGESDRLIVVPLCSVLGEYRTSTQYKNML